MEVEGGIEGVKEGYTIASLHLDIPLHSTLHTCSGDMASAATEGSGSEAALRRTWTKGGSSVRTEQATAPYPHTSPSRSSGRRI